jgi:tetratricopeptide (TPR) repeat protein
MMNGIMKEKSNKTITFQVSSKTPLSIFLISVFILFIYQSVSGQQSIAFSGVDTLVENAMELVYHEKYDEAICICENVIKTYPNNPLGYLGRAGIYHILMLNYRTSFFDNEFDSVSTLAIQIGAEAIKKNKQDASAYFVLGASYGFRGLNRIRKGKWFGAFRDGLRGISNIKKAHKLDKELYDTYYALGLFYYWKSAKAKVLTFLMMMKDERKKGIEYLRIVSEKGLFSKYEAQFALVEIYYYEYRYEEALIECLTLRDKFPHDPTWNYLMAKTLGKLNRWTEAMFYFRFLLDFLSDAPYKSNNFIAECHYGVAKCAYETEDYQTARGELNLALYFSNLWDKKKEIEGPLLDFDKVLKRMKKLDKDLKSN